MVGQIVDRFVVVVRDEGIRSALSKMAVVMRRLLNHQNTDDFDDRLHIETSKEVSLWRLRISSKNAKFGYQYQTTAPSVFCDAIASVLINPQNFTFIDLGSGKGRTLILAANSGFKRIMGVEFSPDLAAIARKNLTQLGVAAEVVEADASNFTFPDENILVYLYNPFGPSVMKSVAAQLVAWRESNQKAAFIVYVNPTCADVFDSSEQFETTSSGPSFRVWKLKIGV